MGSIYDKKQGLDGMMTLTHDPLVKSNIRKAKLAERERQIKGG